MNVRFYIIIRDSNNKDNLRNFNTCKFEQDAKYCEVEVSNSLRLKWERND